MISNYKNMVTIVFVFIACASCEKNKKQSVVKSTKQPNIIFIMSDDHATQAISSYGSTINKTPQIDKLAAQGIQFNNTSVTNAYDARPESCELYDLKADASEMNNLIAQPKYQSTVEEMKSKLTGLRKKYKVNNSKN